jgi:hypothetical protein
MSATVPVIGSDAGGIPHGIREGANGVYTSEVTRMVEATVRDGQ